MTIDKKLIVLAALAASKGKTHTPVQIQKLLFLIDKNVPQMVQGPHFDFTPYDYGPFDKDVYTVLEGLAKEGLVEIIESGQIWKKYALTLKGQELGQKVLDSLESKGREFINELSTFVLSLSFPQLVSAIYKAYPEMKQNSVFRD
ncbi:MAG: hypothetical protein HZB22_03200 [Deltaproteobacteria bacterium]|nr:hypothetical protein [Deltaproteobacteria bacterium]